MSVSEAVTIGTAIIQVSATDSDVFKVNHQVLYKFSQTGGGYSQFAINSVNGSSSVFSLYSCYIFLFYFSVFVLLSVALMNTMK